MGGWLLITVVIRTLPARHPPIWQRVPLDPVYILFCTSHDTAWSLDPPPPIKSPTEYPHPLIYRRPPKGDPLTPLRGAGYVFFRQASLGGSVRVGGSQLRCPLYTSIYTLLHRRSASPKPDAAPCLL